jgi:predicted DNA-binding protein with PD1-like motif
MKVILEDEVIVAKLEIGEEFMGTLTEFVTSKKITAGSISAIGALRDYELGYYYLDRKEYGRKKFEPIAELIACSGNIALREGKAFLHVHAALGQQDFSLVGGHLFSGIVAVTVEVVLQKLPGKMERRFDERTGLFLLDVCG